MTTRDSRNLRATTNQALWAVTFLVAFFLFYRDILFLLPLTNVVTFDSQSIKLDFQSSGTKFNGMLKPLELYYLIGSAENVLKVSSIYNITDADDLEAIKALEEKHLIAVRTDGIPPGPFQSASSTILTPTSDGISLLRELGMTFQDAQDERSSLCKLLAAITPWAD